MRCLSAVARDRSWLAAHSSAVPEPGPSSVSRPEHANAGGKPLSPASPPRPDQARSLHRRPPLTRTPPASPADPGEHAHQLAGRRRQKSSRFLVRCGPRSCVRLWSDCLVEYRPELGDDDVQRVQLAPRPGEDQRAFQVGDHQQRKAGRAGGGNAEGDECRGPASGRVVLRADTADRDEALRLGVVDEIAGPAVLLDRAVALASQLGSYPAAPTPRPSATCSGQRSRPPAPATTPPSQPPGVHHRPGSGWPATSPP